MIDVLIIGKEIEVSDSYDHVEIYPRNFAPEKPKRSKLKSANNKETGMGVSLGSFCFLFFIFFIILVIWFFNSKIKILKRLFFSSL